MQRVLVYGGKGALGSSIVKFFKAKGNWTTINVDLAKNEEASLNILVSPSQNFTDQAQYVKLEVEKQLSQQKLDAVLCVAGGWGGGNLKSKELIQTSELMWKQSVQTSLISAQIASFYLKEGGFLLLPGAAGATGPTPGMIGYGLAKSAVHHLVRTLAQTEESGLPPNTSVAALMPNILDTEMNRKAMPSADFSTWTKLDDLSEKIYGWTVGVDRPKNGSLVLLKTSNNKTEYTEQ